MLNKLVSKYKSMPVQVRASFWFLICSFLQKGISTITTPIFTRLLSTVEYGQYNVFNSWLGIVTIFVTLNLSYGVYAQGLVKFDKERDILTSSLQGLTLLLVVIWTIVYLAAHEFWNNLFSLTTVQMLAMLIMIWTSAVFSFWTSEQRVQYKYRLLVAITILVSLAKPIVGIIFVINATDKVTARILGLVLVELVGYTGLFVAQMRRGKTFFSLKFWKYAIAFNIPLIPHYLSQSVLNSADRIMIESMVGADKAGIYSLAYSLALIMTLFNNALMSTISPWIYQKIKDKKLNAIAPIAYLTLIGVAGVNLLLIALAPEAVAIFAPASYYEAIWVIPPVAMSVYFMYMYDLYAKFAFYYEKTNFIMLASVIGAALNVVLNYIFIKFYGYVAAAYTTWFCYILYSLCHYLFMNKVCNEFCDGVRPYDTKKIFKITIPFLACGFILMLTYNYPIIRYSLLGIFVVVLVVKRKQIMDTIKHLLNLKKQS